MNTLDWGGPGAQYPSLGFIGAISLPVSLFMVVATLLAAFNTHVQTVLKALFSRVLEAFSRPLAFIMRLGRPDNRQRTAKEYEDLRVREAWKQWENRRKRRNDDFWATARETGGRTRRPYANRATRESTGFGSGRR